MAAMQIFLRAEDEDEGDEAEDEADLDCLDADLGPTAGSLVSMPTSRPSASDADLRQVVDGLHVPLHLLPLLQHTMVSEASMDSWYFFLLL